MNKAIRMAQGEYCIFMNSGDHFFSSQSLENAAKMLNGSDYYVGETIIIDCKLASLCLPPQNMSFRFIRDKVLQHQSTFTRTQLLKEHPYNENLKIVSDWAHFLENWYFKKCSYQAINTIVAVYYTDGISFTNGDLLKKERKEVFTELFGSTSKLPHIKGPQTWKTKDGRTLKDVENSETAEEKKERINDDFAFKLKKALKMKPVSRDWKILRTGFKFLWKDLAIKSK